MDSFFFFFAKITYRYMKKGRYDYELSTIIISNRQAREYI